MPLEYEMPKTRQRTVWFEGLTQLDVGYTLCYNRDFGTPATNEPGRDRKVEIPSTTNIRWFAGVVAQKPPSVGPCWVVINEPGSVCQVHAKVNATVAATRMTVMAGQHYMYTAGFDGEGTALCLQTLNKAAVPGLILATLQTGAPSGGVELFTPVAGANTTHMIGGVTFFAAGEVATNATFILADGLILGMHKAFISEGAITTADIVITVTTPGVPAVEDSTSATVTPHNTFTIDAAGEHLSAIWDGKAWQCSGTVATTV